MCVQICGCVDTYRHTYIHACMHACLRTYVRTYVQTYTHTYTHTCICRFLPFSPPTCVLTCEIVYARSTQYTGSRRLPDIKAQGRQGTARGPVTRYEPYSKSLVSPLVTSFVLPCIIPYITPLRSIDTKPYTLIPKS